MFTTCCFIRKNTPELVEKLEELGYKKNTTYLEHKHNLYAGGSTYTSANFTNKYRIDCGTNEELFLSLAALRDDTDKDQWFTNGTDWGIWQEEGSFHGKPITGFEFHYLPSSIDYDSYHKATVKEIIEHFTTEK